METPPIERSSEGAVAERQPERVAGREPSRRMRCRRTAERDERQIDAHGRTSQRSQVSELCPQSASNVENAPIGEPSVGDRAEELG